MNEEIGQRVREVRGSMSQAELAETLQARGASWSQQTVATVESGRRPLRFAEAVLIADELGVSLDVLAGRPSITEQQLRTWATRAEDRLRRARRALEDIEHEGDPFAPRWER